MNKYIALFSTMLLGIGCTKSLDLKGITNKPYAFSDFPQSREIALEESLNPKADDFIWFYKPSVKELQDRYEGTTKDEAHVMLAELGAQINRNSSLSNGIARKMFELNSKDWEKPVIELLQKYNLQSLQESCQDYSFSYTFLEGSDDKCFGIGQFFAENIPNIAAGNACNSSSTSFKISESKLAELTADLKSWGIENYPSEDLGNFFKELYEQKIAINCRDENISQLKDQTEDLSENTIKTVELHFLDEKFSDRLHDKDKGVNESDKMIGEYKYWVTTDKGYTKFTLNHDQEKNESAFDINLTVLVPYKAKDYKVPYRTDKDPEEILHLDGPYLDVEMNTNVIDLTLVEAFKKPKETGWGSLREVTGNTINIKFSMQNRKVGRYFMGEVKDFGPSGELLREGHIKLSFKYQLPTYPEGFISFLNWKKLAI